MASLVDVCPIQAGVTLVFQHQDTVIQQENRIGSASFHGHEIFEQRGEFLRLCFGIQNGADLLLQGRDGILPGHYLLRGWFTHESFEGL